MKTNTLYTMASVFVAAIIGAPACNDTPEGLAGVGQVCTNDLDCAAGLKCINNFCAVDPGNLPPIAEAGANRVTVEGFQVALDGTNSSDPEEQPLTYQWAIKGSPAGSSATLSIADAAQVSFTPDAPGVYDLELVVNDGAMDSAPAKVAVFVFDSEGSFPTLPTGSECVEDFQCASGDCTDGVCAANFPPSANGGPSREVALGEVVELSAEGSSDPDGDALTYAWQLSQTPAGSTALLVAAADGVSASFTPDLEGLYVVNLVANDGKLASSPATIGIYAGDEDGLRADGEPCTKNDECNSGFCFQEVCKTNEAPIADAGGPQLGAVGETLTFDGGNSQDPEQFDLGYSWDINKAPTGSVASLAQADSQTPTLVPDLEGLYLIRLVVNDGQLDSLPSVVAVVVGGNGGGVPAGGECAINSDCTSNKCIGSTCATNAAPVADAGGPQDVVTGATVELNGLGSSDSDGDPLTYAWSLSVPDGSTAALDDSTSATPTFVADVSGLYQVSLVVSDGNLASVAAVTAVVASALPGGLPDGSPCATDSECASGLCALDTCSPNGLPIAVVNELIYTEPALPVSLDGTTSSDPDGHALTYQWQLAEVPAGSAAALDDNTSTQPSFTPDIPGVYFFQLVVNDGYDDSSPAIGAVIAQAGTPNGSPCAADAQCISGFCDVAGVCAINQPPVADAGESQVIEVGSSATLSAAASVDPEGKPLQYVWTIAGAPAGSTAALDDSGAASPSFDVDLPGLYTLKLSVSDGYNIVEAGVAVVGVVPGLLPDGSPCTVGAECLSGDCDASVCVSNGAPVAVAAGPQSVLLGTPFMLDGTGSSDPEGDSLTFAWTLLNAPAGSTAAIAGDDQALASLVSDIAGTYSFILIVNDGKRDSAPVGVNVIVPPNDAPAAALSVTTTAPFLSGKPVALDASASVDPNGDALTFTWSFLAAPTDSNATVMGSGDTATFVPDVGGTYVAQVTVSDGALSDFDVAVIVVIGINTPPLADAGADTFVAASTPHYLFGHNSTDGDGDTLTYTWSISAEPAGSAATLEDSDAAIATVQGLVPGEYVFELSVSDGVDTDTDTVTVTVAAPDVTLDPYFDWLGTLSAARTLYYVDNNTYESWTFDPGFNDVASGVSGVLIDRERLGPWAEGTQALFDWVVQWDPSRGLLLVGLTGEVPGLGPVTSAAEPPLVLYPAAGFNTGTQTFYSLIQTFDADGTPITQVMRRSIALDETPENPAQDFSNGVAGGNGTEALLLQVRTKSGQAAEVVAQEALVAGQGMFAERRAAGIVDFEDLFNPSTPAQSRLLTYNDTEPTPGGSPIEPASAPLTLDYVPSVCLPDATPCVDNLNASDSSADCPTSRPYCRFQGTCTTSSSLLYPYCPFSNQQESALNPTYSQDADWSGQTPLWTDPLDLVEVPGIPDGMEATALYLGAGHRYFDLNVWRGDRMLFGFIALDTEPHPNMTYTIGLRQNPPEDTVGDIQMQIVYDEFACCDGPWKIIANQSVSLGVGPDVGCNAYVREQPGGLAFAIPMFAHGGYELFSPFPLPSIYELLNGYLPGSGGATQDDDARAYVQFEACGLYADGCSDEILAPIQVDLPEPAWEPSLDDCGGGFSEL